MPGLAYTVCGVFTEQPLTGSHGRISFGDESVESIDPVEVGGGAVIVAEGTLHV